MRVDKCETVLQLVGTHKMFKVGDRVGVSKVLGRGGPAWRPATIIGPSNHPNFQYYIEWEDKNTFYRHCTVGHLCTENAYEKWLKGRVALGRVAGQTQR